MDRARAIGKRRGGTYKRMDGVAGRRKHRVRVNTVVVCFSLVVEK